MTGWVVLAPVPVRWQGSHQHRLRDALLVASDTPSHLTATCRRPEMDGLAEVEVFSQGREVSNPLAHVGAGAGLVGPAVAPPVVGNDAVALAKEEGHLGVPV